MKETVRIYAFLLIDSHGNRCLIAVDDLETEVMTYLLRDKEDSLLHFESEARHLKNWADMNGLEFHSTEQNVDFYF